MAITVHCDIVSAEEKVFSGLVELLVCVGEGGELGVRPGHHNIYIMIYLARFHLFYL